MLKLNRYIFTASILTLIELYSCYKSKQEAKVTWRRLHRMHRTHCTRWTLYYSRSYDM